MNPQPSDRDIVDVISSNTTGCGTVSVGMLISTAFGADAETCAQRQQDQETSNKTGVDCPECINHVRVTINGKV